MQINEIYNENCLDTMKRMPDNFIDLTVTSPPYDNLRTYKGFVFPFEDIAKELFRVTKVGGVVVWVVGDATINGSETGTSFKQALFFMDCGFRLHDTMIYYKTHSTPLTHNRYEQYFEYMFVFSKGKPKAFNPILENTVRAGDKHIRTKANKENGSAMRSRQEYSIYKETKIIRNVWHITPNNTRHEHPAIFPERLAHDHIISWSNEGDLVYDPFMGSGTTAKMAILNKRNYIGSEISSEYCEIIKKRLEQMPLKLDL
jgi:DNA modification methylase